MAESSVLSSIIAPAKINLFLRVGGRRPDGFHEVLSLMQAISLCDTISLVERQGDVRDELTVIGPEAAGIPADSSNLILRAVAALRKHGAEVPPLSITLDKRIPAGAGLGGGSSDATSALKAIAEQYSPALGRSALAEIAAELGSDTSFFLGKGSAIAAGRGEIVNDVALPGDYQVVIITPPTHIATARAYARLGQIRQSQQLEKNILTDAQIADTISRYSFVRHTDELLAQLRIDRNDFEISYLATTDGDPFWSAYSRELMEIRGMLEKAGAQLVRLSGSGASVFGIFADSAFAPDATLTNSRARGWRAFACRPICLSDF